MHNVARAIEMLEIIRSRGVRLAIDDFGTGYSSMSLMKKFPVDTIKIDRSFVQDLPDDAEDRAIAQAIISMSKALGHDHRRRRASRPSNRPTFCARMAATKCRAICSAARSRRTWCRRWWIPAYLTPAGLRALGGVPRAARGGKGATFPRRRLLRLVADRASALLA